MIQIRSGVFETNSSSTHSICIQKKPVDADYKSIEFLLGEYGWETNKVNFADYLYTAIMMDDRESVRKQNMAKLKSILDAHHISYTFEEPEFEYFDGNTYLENGYIDHYEDIGSFVDTVLNDEDMLLRGLFGNYSSVYTGNDNSCDNESMCNVAHEYRYVREDNAKPDGDDFDSLRDYYSRLVYKKTGNWNNPYYDPDNFDYFYKGN